jgi:hypothetical protein
VGRIRKVGWLCNVKSVGWMFIGSGGKDIRFGIRYQLELKTNFRLTLEDLIAFSRLFSEAGQI